MSALSKRLNASFKDYESLGAKQTITLTVQVRGKVDIDTLRVNISTLSKQFQEINFTPPFYVIKKRSSLEDVCEIFSKGNQSHPLEFYLLGEKEEYFFIGLYHHSFCDGLGGLEVFKRILEPGAPPNFAREKAALKTFQIEERENFSLKKGLLIGAKYISAKSELEVAGQATMDGQRKVTIVSRPIKEVRDLKNKLGCTLNELYLFGVSQVLKTLYPEGKHRTALVPVNLRPRGLRATLGNFILVVPVELPLAEQFDLESMHEVSRQLNSKENLSAFRSARRVVLALPRFLRIPTFSRLARATTCIATYVPDGISKRELCGGKIVNEFGMPALLPGHELGFCLITTKEEFSVGITTGGKLLNQGEQARIAFESVFTNPTV